MLGHTFMGVDVYYVVHWFFIYSILGWTIESVYMSFCNKKLTNRGFIRGPICPIYGVGALTVYFVLRPFAGNYLELFVFGSLMATAIEFCTAKIMIRVFGGVWWDYNEKPFNYQGIICLESSIVWGLYSVFEFWFLQSFVERIVKSYPVMFGRILGIGLISYYLFAFCTKIYHNRKESQDEGSGGIFYIS